MTSYVSPECLILYIYVSPWTSSALLCVGDAVKIVWNTKSINTSLPLCRGQTLQLCQNVDMVVRSIQVKAFFGKESNFLQSIWLAIRAEPPASGSEVLISVCSLIFSIMRKQAMCSMCEYYYYLSWPEYTSVFFLFSDRVTCFTQ